ncbi:MAG: KAP family NTPase [Alphaproteobacteria bacterium]
MTMCCKPEFLEDVDTDTRDLLDLCHPESCIHKSRVNKISALIGQIAWKKGDPEGNLSKTIGVFGPWGSGKTTFLAALASNLLGCTYTDGKRPDSQSIESGSPRYSVIYLNAGQCTTATSIVVTLLEKLIRQVDPKPAHSNAWQSLLSSARCFSHCDGDAVSCELSGAREGLSAVTRRITEQSLVIMIDELDRCFADEAYSALRQIRILFAHCSSKIIFVIAANPEPISRALLNRHSLCTDKSEGHHVLERFFDYYTDIPEPRYLDRFVRDLWTNTRDEHGAFLYPTVIHIDDTITPPRPEDDLPCRADELNGCTALQGMKRTYPLYSNLRVMKKAADFVVYRKFPGAPDKLWKDWRWLTWTMWHLEIMRQMDPAFRQDISYIAEDVRVITGKTCFEMKIPKNRYEISGRRSDSTKRIFGLFREIYWLEARKWYFTLANAECEKDPQCFRRLEILRGLLQDIPRMDFIIIMCLLPPADGKPHQFVKEGDDPHKDLSFTDEALNMFQAVLANY